jgi:glycosyltransferase involved in cell wall biosynthesis
MNFNINNTCNTEISGAKISVIIPFHGDISDLTRCLNGLRDQNCSFSFEVIVVESANYNDINKLIDLNPNITFISFDSIVFPGKARNIGVKKSKSNLLAFIDGDCVPEPTWLSEIYSSLKNGNEIVIGPIFNLYPFHPIASIDNLLLFPDFQQYRPSKNIKHFPACNLGITKRLFLKTGGFLENMKIGEDTTFSRYALKKCNSKILYNNKMIVRHSGRKSFIQFMRHHECFGYYREYLKPKIYHGRNKSQNNFLFSVLFGFRRLVYISIRTLQWNPIGFLRIIFYFPFFILGLSAWVKGFWERNQQHSEG